MAFGSDAGAVRADVLRGLGHLRAAGVIPDDRVAEAIDLVRAERDADGRRPLETPHPGELRFPIDDGEGKPSRWNTLRATRLCLCRREHRADGAECGTTRHARA
ncbi:hypothetical protein [Streptomyces cellulosae]|uniref:Uncharacterized protein n=1 Tax=Streptomyces cellulosae TaxID=1968 RepID=A0ABW7Y7K3_STRCE